jgi:hypothetical protein
MAWFLEFVIFCSMEIHPFLMAEGYIYITSMYVAIIAQIEESFDP